MTLPPRLRLSTHATLLALVTLLAWSRAVRAQDAGDEDAGSDADVLEHRIVAYDPQRSVGYGGCDVAGLPPAPSSIPASGLALALVAAGIARGRRRPAP